MQGNPWGHMSWNPSKSLVLGKEHIYQCSRVLLGTNATHIEEAIGGVY